MNTAARRSAFLLLPALLALGACSLPQAQPDPVHYYTLTAAPAETAVRTGGVQVRPVRLAGHLRSRAFALRVSDHEVRYSDFARWAEPLDEAITRILRARLADLPGGRTVSVEIIRCEPLLHQDGAVDFAATYTIQKDNGTSQSGDIAFTNVANPWDARNPATLVPLLQQAIDKLAASLVTTLALPTS